MANWDYDDPATSELRAPRVSDEDPTPQGRGGRGRKKDTNRWCKGKVGVEHDLRIRLKRGVAYRRAQLRNSARPHAAQHCGWSWAAWQFYGDWHYQCDHEIHCTRCGKIQGGKIFRLEPQGCPEYDLHPKPAISAEQAWTAHWEKRKAERQQRSAQRATQRQQTRTARRARRSK